MMKELIKDIIEENKELKYDIEFYKYIIENTLNINDRLIAEVAELEEELELLKTEKEELKKVNIILNNDNYFINNKYQKLKSNLENLIITYSGGN